MPSPYRRKGPKLLTKVICETVEIPVAATPEEVAARLEKVVDRRTRLKGISEAFRGSTTLARLRFWYTPYPARRFAVGGFKLVLVRPLYDAGRPVVEGSLSGRERGTVVQAKVRPSAFSVLFGAAIALATALLTILAATGGGPWAWALLSTVGIALEVMVYLRNRKLAIKLLKETVTKSQDASSVFPGFPPARE